jgi:hypothetical protein
MTLTEQDVLDHFVPQPHIADQPPKSIGLGYVPLQSDDLTQYQLPVPR